MLIGGLVRCVEEPARVGSGDTRHMSRGMSIIDHSTRDGLKGLLTIAGGKLTTYRLMAEHVVDAMCEQRGETRPCRTADENVPGSETGTNYVITHRLHDREENWQREQILCECELMSRKMFVDALATQPKGSFDDLRRQLRLGMGPCQGGFCSMRATGVALETGHIDAERATGIELTSSFAMHPAASVSGLYFGHPDARYFTVDRVTRDQVTAYAERKRMPLKEVERWLSPNLGYEPA